MNTQFTFTPQINLYFLQALAKGFSVFFFVLLPIFYAQGFLSSQQLGYIGALFIIMLILSAIVVAKWLHTFETKQVLQIASVIVILSSVLLLFSSSQANLALLTLAYAIMGTAVGLAMSGVNALAAQLTQRGDRYRSLAQLGMLSDLVRIVFPLLAAGAVAIGQTNLAIVLIILAAAGFAFLAGRMPSADIPDKPLEGEEIERLTGNKNFLFVLFLEFLDSFSSSQLFVFLPLIFLAKGYSLESSLLLQSCIFLGYLTGRLLVSALAKKLSGIRAIALAEIGMVLCIVLLLVSSNMWILYLLSFALGVFARGTSPAIKAVGFDTLTDRQMKKGSALHVVAGDSGSALGQLLFGLSIAWFGVNSPFITAAIVATVIAVLCFVKSERKH